MPGLSGLSGIRSAIQPGVERRQFLKALGATFGSAVAAAALPRFAMAASDTAYPFSEVPSSISGITWRHTAGISPEKYLPESTGAGCAVFDYDNDGWMDIYLVNSGKCDIFTPAEPLRNALYHNNRDGTFTDVTEKAGVGSGGYGMGAAVGDYNGDGFADLYVTQYGRSILYRNNGDGTFTDVTEQAGVAAPGWASSAVWFDYDNDGRLDLFVCRFVEFSKAIHHNCGAPNIPALKGMNEYCYPKVYSPRASWLYHNNGDGTFTDVSRKMGIADNPGKSWGVVATDINNDGWMDLFVSNDTEANFLFKNNAGRKFEEIGFTSGVAYGEGGKARSGMGVDSADFRQSGWMDLFVTNLNHEFHGFYQNRRDETFDDIAAPTGIANATKLVSGWGVKFFDYDNDGSLDLMIANGHPDDLIEKIYDNVGYRERLLLFHNNGGSGTDRCQCREWPCIFKSPFGPGPGAGRFRQRRSRRRIDLLQQRAAGFAAQQCWQPASLAGDSPHRQESECRCYRCARYLSGRQSEADADESRRWQLPFIARSENGSRHRRPAKT